MHSEVHCSSHWPGLHKEDKPVKPVSTKSISGSAAYVSTRLLTKPGNVFFARPRGGQPAALVLNSYAGSMYFGVPLTTH